MIALLWRWALVAAIVMAAGHAHANGAFPDSLRIIVPADRPAEIILATNFGLIMSRDDGASWDWVCEHGDGYLATQYQAAAPPSRRIFAVAPAGLAYTDDDACGWSLALDLMSTTVTDAFADPVNPNRVLALASFIDLNGQAKNGLFVSVDAGKTFGAPKVLAPADSTFASVEVAASQADRIYLTAFHSNLGRTPGSSVIHSEDGGGTWTTSDVTPVTGDRIVRIATVDPVDPKKVYFRVTGSEDAIGLSADGGVTMTLPLVVTAQLTALLRRANGQILVSALDVVDGALYQSTDAGKSFSRMATRLGIRALAERAGKVYVATDDVVDGFALAVSTDDGATFKPLLRFNQVKGTRACGNLKAMCATTCSMLVNVGTFIAATCANAPGSDGSVVPGGDAGGGVGANPVASPRKGCGCHLLPHDQASGPILPAWAVAAVLLWRRRR